MKENNLSHGDLKPSNILLASNGDMILTDFGLGSLISVSQINNEKQKRRSLFQFTTELVNETFNSFESDFEAAAMLLYILSGNEDISEMR